mgnify:CR=1 FL=1
MPERIQSTVVVLMLLCTAYAGYGNADPTAPPAWARAPEAVSTPQATARSAPALQLQQIVLGLTRCAVINQRLLQEGDDIEGYRVVRIDAERVHLSSRQGALILSLIKETVRSPVRHEQGSTAINGPQGDSR